MMHEYSTPREEIAIYCVEHKARDNLLVKNEQKNPI